MIDGKSIKKRIRLGYHELQRTVDQKLGSRAAAQLEATLLLLGKQMSWGVAAMPANTDFRKVGFKVFSQWDEDGLIQYLISKIPIDEKTFIEFGVENYEESNTRFLLLNDHWQGMVLDACVPDIRYIETDRIHWEFDLQVKRAWITCENIDALLAGAGFLGDLGLLSIDIDGNEYWIWEAIESLRPRIVIVEYNSVFGLEPLSIPYQEDFSRSAAHHSNLYYGCSIAALHHLAKKKGYLLLGSNAWGHNAFFVRADVAGELRGVAPREAYVLSKFRESRGPDGRPTYVRGTDRIKLIEHLPVINVETGERGLLKNLHRPVSNDGDKSGQANSPCGSRELVKQAF